MSQQPSYAGRPYAPLAEAFRQVISDRGLSAIGAAKEIAPDRKRRWLEPINAGNKLLPDDDWERLIGWGWEPDERATLLYGMVQSQIGLGLGRSLAQGDDMSPQLVGIGALNSDHIRPASQRKVDEIDVAVDGLERGNEDAADEAELDEWIDEFGSETFNYHQPGGSAFNVIRLVALQAPDVTTGFVGVRGRPPAKIGSEQTVGVSVRTHDSVLSEATDTTHLKTSDNPGGRVASVLVHRGEDKAERTMKVFQGANLELRNLLIERFWNLAGYLGGARQVHISSLVDDATTEVLATLIEQAIALAPNLKVSLDPGWLWASKRRESVQRLLACTSTLILNERELRELSDRFVSGFGNAGEEQRASAVRNLLRPPGSVVVVKHAGSTAVFTGGDSSTVELGQPLAKVEDDTGAGDVFAAGYFAYSLSERLWSKEAARHGMRLASDKVRRVGLAQERR